MHVTRAHAMLHLPLICQLSHLPIDDLDLIHKVREEAHVREAA